jgi:calcium-dependent protein kinase
LNDKYEFIDKNPIVSGGYGKIYRIRDKKVKTEYVLKKLIKSNPKNPGVMVSDKYINGTDKEEFENEKNFLINVKGTNILNIIDFYDDEKNDCYYFVFEKMDGDLQKMLNTKYSNGMSSKMIKKIFSQLNSGLEIMIKEGKVHRDLKPSNILYSYIDNKKKDFIIKIGDFGLATDLSTTVKTGTDCGTNIFKAPEVESGKFNNKCDLYSIGIILYMLKTGDYIFEGKSIREIIKNQDNNKLKKDTDDKILNDLIKRLVVADPDKRMNWNDYFNHPFFKDNDDDNEILKLKEEIKKLNDDLYKYKMEIQKFKNENNNLTKHEKNELTEITQLDKNKRYYLKCKFCGNTHNKYNIYYYYVYYNKNGLWK